MTGSVTYGRSVTHRHLTANESTSSDLAASGRDGLIGTLEHAARNPTVEREENAEECWISLRLGRSVALLLHYFVITAGHKLLFLPPARLLAIRSSLSLFYELFVES